MNEQFFAIKWLQQIFKFSSQELDSPSSKLTPASPSSTPTYRRIYQLQDQFLDSEHTHPKTHLNNTQTNTRSTQMHTTTHLQRHIPLQMEILKILVSKSFLNVGKTQGRDLKSTKINITSNVLTDESAIWDRISSTIRGFSICIDNSNA
jgi:hypothetical protein